MNDIRVKLNEISKKGLSIKTAVIDTITYAMVESVSKTRDTKGYEKFTTYAMELIDLFDEIKTMREDLMVIITSHDELEDDGKGSKVHGFKHVAGKLAREKFVVEGVFDTVLFANSTRLGDKNYYWFETQTDGTSTAKSPEGMFPAFKIQNNMQYVIESYKAYHNGEELPEPMLLDDIEIIDNSNF